MIWDGKGRVIKTMFSKAVSKVQFHPQRALIISISDCIVFWISPTDELGSETIVKEVEYASDRIQNDPSKLKPACNDQKEQVVVENNRSVGKLLVSEQIESRTQQVQTQQTAAVYYPPPVYYPAAPLQPGYALQSQFSPYQHLFHRPAYAQPNPNPYVVPSPYVPQSAFPPRHPYYQQHPPVNNLNNLFPPKSLFPNQDITNVQNFSSSLQSLSNALNKKNH